MRRVIGRINGEGPFWEKDERDFSTDYTFRRGRRRFITAPFADRSGHRKDGRLVGEEILRGLVVKRNGFTHASTHPLFVSMVLRWISIILGPNARGRFGLLLPLVILCAVGGPPAHAQVDAFFPDSVRFDADIPSPSEFLGREIGARHTPTPASWPTSGCWRAAPIGWR